MSKFHVLEPLRHNGEDYAPGDQVDLDAKSAAELVKAAAVSKEKPADKAGEPEAGQAA